MTNMSDNLDELRTYWDGFNSRHPDFDSLNLNVRNFIKIVKILTFILKG